MTSLLVLLSLPCLLWTQGVETAPSLKEAGIVSVCLPADATPETVESWRTAGFTVNPLSAKDMSGREALAIPGIVPGVGIASPTRKPFVTASGWRFRRAPAGKFSYDVPAGKGPLALAETFAYNADVVLKVDPADVPEVGRLFTFLKDVPARDLPDLADLAVVDDGTPLTGEVLNLLTRRNLLYQRVKAATPAVAKQFPLTIKLGSKAYPAEVAADPSAFALKIRRQLTDERRTLRIYGSEVVIGRLTGKAGQARLQLLNYGGREMGGLRIRVRGKYRQEAALSYGEGPVTLLDFMQTADGATEFTLPALKLYAVIDLVAEK